MMGGFLISTSGLACVLYMKREVVMELVSTLTNKTPMVIKKAPKRRPLVVTGTTSPYPTVATVEIAHYNASELLVIVASTACSSAWRISKVAVMSRNNVDSKVAQNTVPDMSDRTMFKTLLLPDWCIFFVI